MSSTSGVTILPDTNSHFNGKNYASWKLQITELLKGKGLWGYIEGTTTRPTAPGTTTTTPTTVPLPPDPTPIYSSSPSYDEWVFRDQLAHSHIVLNVLDPIGLGVRTDGTAKECWDSIIAEHAKKTDMALSEAEASLNAAKFDGNSDINVHVADLRTKRHAINDLCTTALSDQEFKGIIIRSIIPTDNWMPILPSLYQMATSSDIISHLQTHAATLRAAGKGPSLSQALAAGAPTTPRGCRNPDCKARDKTRHTTEICYWPGGGKEGQFPPNFGRPRHANQASTNNTADTTRHFVLAARAPTIEIDRDEDGLVVEDGSTGERLYEWNGTRSFWRWDEPDSDFESASSNEFSDWSSTFGSETSATDYSDLGDETDLEMPPLTDVEDEDEADEPEDDMPPLVDADFDEEEFERVGQFTCEADPAGTAFVTTTFEGHTPSVTLTFMDSGASDYFFRNREDFTDYTPVAFRTGSSAVEGKGTFEILGQGTAMKTFRLDGKDVKLTFKNALHSPSLAANLISVSALDKAGLSTVFSNGRAAVRDNSGNEIFAGRGSDGMYVLDAAPTPQAMSSWSSPTSLCDWHRRFVHMSPKTIEEMASKKLVDGLEITSDPLQGRCEDCILARHARRPFDEPTDPNVDPLELVATDLWGPSRTASPSGKTYMMIFVDSGTSFKAGEFLADKADETTVAAFDRYRRMAETQTGRKVKRVRADQAFAGAKWAAYCAEHGILLELTAPHSSAQNGLAERALCTTMEDTRALLSDSGLADRYWAEAASMSIFTRNLAPSSRHPGVVPAESFSKRRQNVAFLRVFGSTCWAKKPTSGGVLVDGRSKLEDRSKKCIFLGYAGSNYRVLDQSGCVFVSRDVIFDEGPAHRTMSVGETEDEPPLTSSSQDTSSPSATEPTPTPAAEVNNEPTLCRSSRLTRLSADATESLLSEQREAEAREKGSEWATNSKQPRASLAASGDPYIPRNYQDALRVDEERWKAAMDIEYQMHMTKHTWDLVDRPEDANVMDCKWVYGMKWDGNGNWIRDKARLVGKGYTQQYGLDYNETWAAMTRLESVRMSAAVAAKLDLHLWQVDFVSAYLNSETKEDIYMRQPPGYVVEGQEDKVCKLVHTIYRTMQGGHDWFETLGKTYEDLGYQTSQADPCVRTIGKPGEAYTITDTYTDDVWGASSSVEEASKRKKELQEKWELTDVGENHYFLGMKMDQDLEAGTISFSQRPYWENVFSDFNLEHLTLRSTPLPVGIILDSSQSPTTQAEKDEMEDVPYRRLLGHVMWGQLATRPDLCYPVSMLAHFQTNPGLVHWKALLHVLGYVKGTMDYGIVFSRDEPLAPVGFVDADYGGCRDTTRSTSGYVFTMAGGPICWSSKRQATVALSTVEAEYVSLTRAAQQMMWVMSWMDEVQLPQPRPGILYGDNQGAVALTMNTRSHHKVKHIQIRQHFIRELVKDGDLRVEFIRGNENPADMFTKPLPRDTHHGYLEALNIVPVE